MHGQKPHLFVCYNSKDVDVASRIVRALQEHGYILWIDYKRLGGQPQSEALGLAIKAAQGAVVLVGTHGMGKWQNLEVELCINQHVERKLPIIPVKIAEGAEFPPILEVYPRLDLCGTLCDSDVEDLISHIERGKATAANSHLKRGKATAVGGGEKESVRRWVWRCSQETSDELTMSVLAIVETVAAVGFAIALVWLAGARPGITLLVPAVSAGLAPVLLLRSPQSLKWGRNLFEVLREKHWRLEASGLASFFLLAIVGLFVRVLATLRYAHAGVRHIPDNWRRIVASTDVTLKPEFVPGTGATYELCGEPSERSARSAISLFSLSLLVWSGLLVLNRLPKELLNLDPFVALAASQWDEVAVHLGQQRTGELAVIIAVIVLGLALSPAIEVIYKFARVALGWIFTSLALLLAYYYRFSLKSTAWVWWPLTIAIRRSTDRRIPLREQGRMVVDDLWSIAARRVAMACVALVLIRGYAIETGHWSSLVQVLAPHTSRLSSELWHPWYVALLIASLCTVTCHVYVNRASRMLTRRLSGASDAERGASAWYWREDNVRRGISILKLAQSLSLFSCGLIAILSAPDVWGFLVDMFPVLPNSRSWQLP